jgi:acyl-CoA dehydrogenase
MSDLVTFFEDAAERLFADTCSPAVVEAAEAGTFPAVMWQALEDFSAPSILVAEADGGMGASVAEAAAVLRVAGRHAAPGLLLETMVANRLLTQAGLPAAGGPVTLGFIDGFDAKGSARNGDWRDWPRPALRWLSAATAVVLVVEAEGGLLVSMSGPMVPDDVLADASGEPLGRPGSVHLAGTDIKPLAGGYASALGLASALRAAQMVGAMQWCLTRTVEFTGERKQFGREIAKFQIIQQHLAQIAGEVVASAAIAEAAAQDTGSDAGGLMVAAARSRLGDAIDVVCALTHQVHGAMGFTAEYPLHRRTRRLMAWRDEFRTVGGWRRRLASPFTDVAASDVWPKLTALRG